MSEQGHLFSGFEVPEVQSQPDRKVPRHYQVECVRRVQRDLLSCRSTLGVLATGLGKTFIAAMLAGETKGRVLFLAHSDELLQQSQEALSALTGEWVGLEQAGFFARGERIVVASVQTLCRDKRLQRFRPGDFELIIVDEAHHATAPTYTKILDYFTGKVFGLTATPDRTDAQALGKVFDETSFVMDIGDGIGGGWLVPVKGRQVRIEEINLTRVKSSHGDFQAGSLDEEMLGSAKAIVDRTLALEPDRAAVCFFPGVQSAEMACAEFNERIPGSAVFVSGETPRDERRYMIERFRMGHVQYLCNCMVATEGFDAPNASMIVQARPTKSRALYAQMVGRGTRTLPKLVDDLPEQDQAAERKRRIELSGKPDMMILDFVGNTGKHKLVGPADVLGGTYEDDVVEKARKLAEDKPGEDVLDLLEEAKRLQADLKAQLAAAVAATRVAVRSRVTTVDPFAFTGFDEAAQDKVSALDKNYGRKPATQAQRDALVRFGVDKDEVARLSKRQASAMMDGFMQRKEKGLATMKMIAIIRRYVPVPDDLPMARGNAGIAYIKKTVWARRGSFNPDTLERLVNGPREPGEDG